MSLPFVEPIPLPDPASMDGPMPLPPAFVVGHTEYLTIHQISAALGIPPRYLMDRVRDGEFGAQKVSKVYMVSSSEFHDWVRSGRLNYKARPSRRIKPLEDSRTESATRENRRRARSDARAAASK